MAIGLPKLDVTFKDAAVTASTRTKEGIVAVMIRTASKGDATITAMSRPSDIPSGMAQGNKKYIERAMLGTNMGKARTVYVVETDVDTEGDHTHLSAGLALLASVSVDYMVIYPDAVSAENTIAVTWVKARRATLNVVKLIAADTAADNEGVINYCTVVKTADGDLTAAQYCSRIAGVFAGLPSSCSGTYAVLEDVLSITPSSDPVADVAAGKLILIHDGVKAKIQRGVNSLTTTTSEKGENWKIIKLVEASDLIGYFCRTTIEDCYIGKYPNTYDNKQLLISAIKTYLLFMETDGMLLPGSSAVGIDLDAQIDYLKGKGVDTNALADQQILEYYTDSNVFLEIKAKRVDTMEDFTLSVIV